MHATSWRKSTRSGNNGVNCVEVSIAQVVRVRDTKDRDGGMLAVPAEAWVGLLRGLGR
ncbi:DUF397 domain-containing protein [Amycolatopsis sp. NPDC059021]|uniref:DUF397 domain-containing protein n=1 Tax=Amycolatopsis sp. NPDC059021 TaxID=3346704 RepID=UPI00367138B5